MSSSVRRLMRKHLHPGDGMDMQVGLAGLPSEVCKQLYGYMYGMQPFHEVEDLLYDIAVEEKSLERVSQCEG